MLSRRLASIVLGLSASSLSLLAATKVALRLNVVRAMDENYDNCDIHPKAGEAEGDAKDAKWPAFELKSRLDLYPVAHITVAKESVHADGTPVRELSAELSQVLTDH
ncbi:MAG: hypothetical protein ABSH53_18540 [Holophaga sp.]|jgi:hypothetical protein